MKKPYRYPHSHKDGIEKQVAEMLQAKLIKHSCSPYASPVLLVKKKDNTWYFCVDYRHLNDITLKDRYPIPNIDKLLGELYRAKCFTKIDLRLRCHQIRVKVEDTYKTTFQTHQGHCEFLVIPFGLTNASATFQALMNQVFGSFLRKFVLVLFYDILMYRPTLPGHVEHLRQVLIVLKEDSLFAKFSKYSFAQRRVEYLGHGISNQGVTMDSSKVECIMTWRTPKTAKKLRKFLGLTRYHRCFIKGSGTIYKSLTSLLQKDTFT